MVMTDGEANEGITQASVFEKELKAKLEQNPVKPVVHCFGFGSSADTSIMTTIATVGEGVYYFIENNDAIATAYGDCLGGLLSVVAQNISLTIEPIGKTNTIQVMGQHKMTTEGKKSTITLKDLFGEEKRDIVIKFGVTEVKEPEETEVASFSLTYFNILTSLFETKTCKLTVPRTAIEKVEKRDEYIDLQINRVVAAEAMIQAKKEIEKKNHETSRKIIDETIKKIETSDYSSNKSNIDLIRDLKEVRPPDITAASPAVDYSGYSQKLASYGISHMQQRSVKSNTNSYATPQQRMMQAASVDFIQQQQQQPQPQPNYQPNYQSNYPFSFPPQQQQQLPPQSFTFQNSPQPPQVQPPAFLFPNNPQPQVQPQPAFLFQNQQLNPPPQQQLNPPPQQQQPPFSFTPLPQQQQQIPPQSGGFSFSSQPQQPTTQQQQQQIPPQFTGFSFNPPPQQQQQQQIPPQFGGFSFSSQPQPHPTTQQPQQPQPQQPQPQPPQQQEQQQEQQQLDPFSNN